MKMMLLTYTFNYMKKSLTLLVLTLAIIGGHAQPHSIQTNAAGKITGNLPELVFVGNKLNFKVSDPRESFTLYTKMLTDKANRAKRQLAKLLLDAEKMTILGKVYSITASDINSVIGELNNVIANPSAAAQTYVPVYAACDDRYYSVAIPGSNDAFRANTVSNDLTISVPAEGGKLHFTLLKTEPFKKITFNWLQQTKADYSGTFDPELFRLLHEQVKAKSNTVREYLAQIQPLLDKSPNYVSADLKPLKDMALKAISFRDDIDGFLSTHASAVNISSQYKDWLLKWMWYQPNYMPALNPFSFKAEGNIGSEPDTSKLEVLRLQIMAREDFYKAIDMKKTTPEQLDIIINEAVILRKERSAIEKAAKDFTTAKSNNDKAILDFGNTSIQLNEGLLMVGKDMKSLFYWQRHHDASNNYQLLNEDITGEYLEDDRVVVLSHNLKPGETSKINLSFKDITSDASQLTDGLSPVIAQLFDAATKLGAFGAPLLAVPKAVDNARIEAQGRVAELLGKLTALQEFDKILEYLMRQSNPVLDIKETVDKTLSYHSELSNPPKKISGPKKASYYMNTVTAAGEASKDKDKPAADTFDYRVNKLYRIFPMAGAFYTTNKFIEMKDGKFSELSHIKFIVGVKVYLKKTDIRSTKFFTGIDEHNTPLWKSRTSIQLGFEAQKPLRNIYLGGGLDLWPGFCISMGAVANKYTYNETHTAETVRTRNLYRTGFYCGLSTDISFFTDVIKFLNLSK